MKATEGALSEEPKKKSKKQEEKAAEQMSKMMSIQLIEERVKENKEKYVEGVYEILHSEKPPNTPSNSIQKNLKDIFKEFMKSVIPVRCPHCESRNGKIRKEGATKFFKLKLSDKDRKAEERAQRAGDEKVKIVYDELESSTMASFSDDEGEGEEEITEEQKRT